MPSLDAVAHTTIRNSLYERWIGDRIEVPGTRGFAATLLHAVASAGEGCDPVASERALAVKRLGVSGWRFYGTLVTNLRHLRVTPDGVSAVAWRDLAQITDDGDLVAHDGRRRGHDDPRLIPLARACLAAGDTASAPWPADLDGADAVRAAADALRPTAPTVAPLLDAIAARIGSGQLAIAAGATAARRVLWWHRSVASGPALHAGTIATCLAVADALHALADLLGPGRALPGAPVPTLTYAVPPEVMARARPPTRGVVGALLNGPRDVTVLRIRPTDHEAWTGLDVVAAVDHQGGIARLDDWNPALLRAVLERLRTWEACLVPRRAALGDSVPAAQLAAIALAGAPAGRGGRRGARS